MQAAIRNANACDNDERYVEERSAQFSQDEWQRDEERRSKLSPSVPKSLSSIDGTPHSEDFRACVRR
jgi:hypothetical protein